MNKLLLLILMLCPFSAYGKITVNNSTVIRYEYTNYLITMRGEAMHIQRLCEYDPIKVVGVVENDELKVYFDGDLAVIHKLPKKCRVDKIISLILEEYSFYYGSPA